MLTGSDNDVGRSMEVDSVGSLLYSTQSGCGTMRDVCMCIKSYVEQPYNRFPKFP